ncbi:IclR family transcriptional regulator [Goodfellowiella coeruleoviolacea]|uniref:Glycerol operon regulatory protein n=1 Tax=Goodfellowiella coeruleoviolacea TaxID=334858 RepID=A0AAE3GIW0_9PSEU|nr:IclR family transcriptional regulator [Goodfellowiella coeruleoviolacea]MCP2168438.1 transcriptional regulator, IclR family [Goodfellowiella coeruleoviolacea]
MSTPDSTPAPGVSLSTTERVAQVLLAFAGDERWLGVSELARRLGLGKAVVHRILQTLVETDLLAHDQTTRRYRLGPGALRLGRNAIRDSELRAAGMPVISRLAALTGETTTLSARIGHSRCYIGQIESLQPIRVTIALGESVPLTIGASGLAILAFLSEADIDLALRTPIQPVTDRTVVDPVVIRERLAGIRKRGWSTTESERVPMSSSVAAPIFDALGEPVGALSVGSVASRVDQARLAELGTLVSEAAADVTDALRQARSE